MFVEHSVLKCNCYAAADALAPDGARASAGAELAFVSYHKLVNTIQANAG